jgi:hypothetical protein
MRQPFLNGLRRLRAEDAADRGVAVGDVEAGDLVVAVVLEAVAGLEQARVDGGRRVAAEREEADGRGCGGVGVVDVHVEHERRIECIVLPVQQVAAVLDEDDVVGVGERAVVERGAVDVAAEEQRLETVVARRALLREHEDRAEAAEGRARLGRRVGVTRRVEHELTEAAVGPEEAVLRPLERRGEQ